LQSSHFFFSKIATFWKKQFELFSAYLECTKQEVYYP
jgi:hypothetical protein